MKAVVAAFNQEKALVGALSVIMNLRIEIFQALVDTAWCWWAPGLVHARGARSHYLGVTDLCSPKFLRFSKLKTAHHHLVSHFSPSPAWCHIILSAATAQHLHTHIFIQRVRCYMTIRDGNEPSRSLTFHNYGEGHYYMATWPPGARCCIARCTRYC